MTSCCSQEEFINTCYEGYIAETKVTYSFLKSGSVHFKQAGHLGQIEMEGTYHINDNIIFIESHSDWAISNSLMETKVKVIGNGCIRDTQGNFYCTDVKQQSQVTEEEFIFRTQTSEEIRNIPLVKNLVDRVFTCDQTTCEVVIDFRRFIKVNGIEYELYQLERNSIRKDEIIMSFAVRRKPFEVYQYFNQNDSLSSKF